VAASLMVHYNMNDWVCI